MHCFRQRRLVSALLAVALVCVLTTGALAAEDVRADILNQAELSPVSPQSAALDRYLDELLPEVLAGVAQDDASEEDDEDKVIDDADKDTELTTYEQVKACYDYLTATVSYGSHTANLGTPVGDTTCRSIYRSYGEVEGFGAVALTARVGMCNAYSAAFILMVREIGLDARLVEGQTKSGGGGYAYHKWAEVVIDDVIYVFDPQLEQDLTAAGLPAYSVFCKTYDQIPGRYIKY